MASKIHLFKKAAIEAGTPENYYLNPSDNLMKIASEWRAIEYEYFLTLTIHTDGFGDLVCVRFGEKSIDIEVKEENKEKAARFEHGDGMKNFSFEMNPNFLNLKAELDPTIKITEGTSRLIISKLKK
ncbi:hypothetical protein MKW94_018931 [Papaver nudicaule]|uniref:Uncharacterized protein n=1 Tax=Papaver nudicaule TaxID=74823 RepID=A0AA41V5S3_PAPNU|nr:hypothetical protein [Papaver nudicaule]